MGKFIKTKKFCFAYLLLVFLILSGPASSIAASPEPSKKSILEEDIIKVLKKDVPCKKIEVQIGFTKEKVDVLKTLSVKFEGINFGKMTADYMTLIYENPVLDLVKLSQAKEFRILSSSKEKMSILISAVAIQGYFDSKAKEFNKKFNRISIKFSPPYIECFFDVPAQEISPETLKLLDKFVKGGKLEGYAAFQIKAKDNALYAFSSKVIVNHFLIPELILGELQKKFNPFDAIPVIKPFQYSVNTITVQNRYLYLTN